MSTSNQLVQKLWNYCNVLRDDGVSTIDYIEQLTYLLFLKMADEQTKPPFDRARRSCPTDSTGSRCSTRDGDELEVHYRHILIELGKQPGMLGVIFRKAQNRIQDPAKLERLIVDLIDQENWIEPRTPTSRATPTRGCCEKNAEDIKSGAGQYFTPRPLIQAMVEVHAAQRRTCDHATRPAAPAASSSPPTSTSPNAPTSSTPTRSAHLRDEARSRLRDRRQHRPAVRDEPAAARHRPPDGRQPDRASTTRCIADPGERFDMVLTNPPFGQEVVADDRRRRRARSNARTVTIVREDFWASTSNKQLNFVQHIMTMLKINGRAAVVVPDNVLFEGGAGETIRRRLLARVRRAHAAAPADRRSSTPRA